VGVPHTPTTNGALRSGKAAAQVLKLANREHMTASPWLPQFGRLSEARGRCIMYGERVTYTWEGNGRGGQQRCTTVVWRRPVAAESNSASRESNVNCKAFPMLNHREWRLPATRLE
jgi:hypothetical protein